jgi:hypothetical protein
MFPVYGWKWFLRNAVDNWDEKRGKAFAEVAETTAKRLLRCGFRSIGKAMKQVYQCCWRICREINGFSRFEYRMIYVLYPHVAYLLSLPRNMALMTTLN